VASLSISILPVTARSAVRAMTGKLNADPVRFWQSWQWQAKANSGAARRL
jgi:hypothetical protein